MVQGYSNFIPEVWSKKLTSILDKNGVMMQCVNRDYEGEIKNAGDTVHIRTYGDVTISDYTGKIEYETLSSPMQTMTINQKKSFAFKVDDISKAQSDVAIMSGYLTRAGIKIDLVKDTYLLSKVADAGNTISSSVINKDNFYQKFVEIARTLKNKNAVSNGKKPWAVINPDLEAIAIQAPEFIQAGDIGDKTLREGSIGRIANIDILVSTNFEAVSGVYNVMAGTNDAITYASQVIQVEKLRDQDSFSDLVRGLYVYDAKVIQPDALVKAVYTLL